MLYKIGVKVAPRSSLERRAKRNQNEGVSSIALPVLTRPQWFWSLFDMKALNRTGNRKTINVNPGLSRNRFVPKPVYPKTGLQNGSETGLENGS